MKTENTLRMARNSLLCFFMALAAGFLVACGGGGGGDVATPLPGGNGGGGGGGGAPLPGGGSGDVGSGTFHAKDWVVGLDYRYLDSGETGKTGAKGAFPLRSGQTVVFSIGQVTLGTLFSVSDAVEDFITPTRIGDEERAVNVEQLLMALDSDGDNGTITFSEQAILHAEAVNAFITPGDIANAYTLTLEVSDDDGGPTVNFEYILPSETEARGLLANTNNCAFSGAFEGRWSERFSDGRTFEGEHALVLLAFNQDDLPAVANPLGTVSAADENLDQIIGAKAAGALYIELWKEGGSSQTAVRDFGSDSGALTIALNRFPVTRTITETVTVGVGIIEEETTLLTLESYDRIAYESTTRRSEGSGAPTVYATESGYYRRANEEVRDADYRIAGFYSDADNDEGEAEIGIYAFSANKGGGSVRPYVGWFSSPLTGSDSVYSNIGEGELSSLLTYTGTPESAGGMTLTEEDGSSFTVSDFTNPDSRGYGAYTYNDGDGEELVGGWCAL